MLGRRILATAAFAAAVSAQSLSIITPNPNSWWVAASQNTVAWTCTNLPSSITNLNVVLTNSNTSILDAPFALIASIPAYDCSFTVTPQQSSQAVSDTYTIELTSALNVSDIYASSQFSIKPAGSTYPPATSSAGASGTAAGSAATSSSSSTSNKSGAVANYVPVGMSMAAAVLLGLVVG